MSIFHLHSRPAHLSVPDEDAGASRVFVGSFLILGLTAVLEIGISSVSGSVSLLSDAVHNVSDALTGVPLWVAFFFSRKKPTARYSYGYGKFEDLAGVMIVVLVLLSSVFPSPGRSENCSTPRFFSILDGWLWPVSPDFWGTRRSHSCGSGPEEGRDRFPLLPMGSMRA